MEKLATDSVLSPAETRIASGYACGLIGKEIADACGISYNTVVRHTQNIYAKAGIPRSTNALVSWFLSVNFKLDLAEFRRRLGAAILLAILSVQTFSGTTDLMAVRRCSPRRIEARSVRRCRRDDGDIYLHV